MSWRRQPARSTGVFPRLAIWTYSSASLRGTKPSKKMHSITIAGPAGVGRGVGVGLGVAVGRDVGVGRGVGVSVAVG